LRNIPWASTQDMCTVDKH